MTAPNSYASLPFVPVDGRYRLGEGLDDDTVNDFWFNTQHDDGTLIAVAEPPGWEGVTYITPIDTSGGRDGGLDGPGSVAPREISVTGAMVSPDAATLRRKIRSLRQLLRNRSRVVWDQYDFGETTRMGLVCRSTGDFRATPEMGNDYGGVATVVSFTLVAANPPYKYATGEAEFIDIGLPVDVVSGRTYSKTYSYNYGLILNPGGIGQAVNRGDVDAYPQFEVTGPVSSPIITNESTGRSFIIVGNIPALTTVTIDSRSGRVTPATYRLVGRPWVLAPGNNNIRWRASSGSFNPSANLRVIWRSTWE
jgi:hypothetical protein